MSGAIVSSGGRFVPADRTGAADEGARVAGSLNRPRRLPPSLASWTKVGAALVANAAATWKANWAGYGIDVVWDPETQRLAMLYGGHDGTLARVGLAYSDDGLNWADYGSNPVFSNNGTAGQPDSGGVGYLSPIWENGTWYGYYIGFPSTGVEQGTPSIRLATATSLTGPWTRQGAMVTTSMFPSGLGAETVTVVYRPTVLKVGSTWYLFTNAGPAPGNEDVWYFTAPAVDGPWTLGSRVIVGESFGGNGIASDPEVIRVGDMFLLVCWTNGAGVAGLHVAYSRLDEFPATWHPQTGIMLAATGSLSRPCLVTLPSGDLALYANANSSAQVDLFVPAGGALAGALAPSVKVTRSSGAGNYSLANNTITALPLDAEVWDKNPATHHDNATNNTRLTCRRTGRYRVFAHLGFATNATGRRWMNVVKNNTASLGSDERLPVTSTPLAVITEADLVEGDYLEVQVFQTSGGALNVLRAADVNGYGPVFGMTWVGP